MNKNCLVPFLLFTLFLPTNLLAKAAQINAGASQKCVQQIEATEKRLKEIPALNLVGASTEQYLSAESGRPVYATHSVNFIVEKTGGGNLMNSPVLMKSISTDLFSKCDAAGSVVFTLNNSDWVEIYGKFTDGSVKKFACAEDLTDMPWGTQPCL